MNAETSGLLSRWSRSAKLALGAGTLWPLVSVLAILPILVLLRLFCERETQMTFLVVTLVLTLLTVLGGLALTVLFLVDAFRSPRLPRDHRALWAIALFTGGPIALPIYWYLHVWKPAR